MSTPNSSGNLRPERRADKNGVVSTRWVKDQSKGIAPEDGMKALIAALGGVPVAAAFNPFPVPLNQNWESTTPSKAQYIVKQVGMRVHDSDRLWDNMDFYTGMLESKYGELALENISEYRVVPYLRDAWLSKHGATMNDRSYMKIGGSEGYEKYREAYGKLATAIGKAEQARDNKNLDLSISSNGQAEADVPVERILSHPPILSEQDAFRLVASRLSASEDNEDKEPSSFKDRVSASIDKKIDAVFDLGEALNETITSRQKWRGEAPKGVGGSTVSWSDLNPFKRKKKQ